MSEKGRGLLILAGMSPKRGMSANDSEEAAEPDDAAEYEPNEAVNGAAEEALGAAKNDDHEGFAEAICKLIDEHAKARAAKE